MLKAGQTTVACARCGHSNTLGVSTCAKCNTPFSDQSALTAQDGGTNNQAVSFQDIQIPSPGTVLAGRYEIIETLGAGGMGAVFKVFDRRLTRIVALKTIHPHLAAT